jgi:collagenase-like PrtC family protease
LKEKSRKHEFIVYEDHNGTHMFTGYSLNLLDKLQGLYDNGLDVIRIDTFLHDDK